MNDKVSDLVDQMKRCGYKVTNQRELILKEFTEKGGHLSAQEVYENVRKVIPHISLTTIYRNIEMLTAIGVLYPVELASASDGSALYEINRIHDHHHHLVCTKCGKIIEFNMCLFQEIGKKLSSITQFKIDEHRLKVFGRCPKCQHGR